MKTILLLLLIAFALSLCNLSGRLKKEDSNSGPAAGSSNKATEPAKPTAGQAAAIAGGKEVKWERQGMSWTIPSDWAEQANEAQMFMMRSPGAGGASLIVNIAAMDEGFPLESSLQAQFQQAESRAKNGEVDEVKWVEIDGVKGVQFREANPERGDGSRRLQWMAYRKYLGQIQLINLMLASQGKDFDRHRDAMYGILYSMKVAHR
ncbi:MAG TPA: hypothetical protein VFY60_03120 [Pyrinomonadaceae bacterium]|nr:hypothetical protein [Pyrinomonadaceae bacterium]